MYTLMILVFIIGYMAIALEHPIKVDKAATALLTGVLCWTIYVLGAGEILNIDMSWDLSQLKDHAQGLIASADSHWHTLGHFIDGEYEYKAGDDTYKVIGHFIDHELMHHLSDVASILFFLLGAMTIVELIDGHEGFSVVTDKIKTTNRVKLLWIICLLTFFFSAALDNLTTAIVMAALLKKIIKGKEDLMLFGGMVVLAANAGGAWSPIGDVTTIMLWIGGQVTAATIVTSLIIPSIVCMLVPLTILSFTAKGHIESKLGMVEKEHLLNPTSTKERNIVFFLGLGCLLFVPVFKNVTHLQPFMGILFGLGLLWLVTEIIHREKNHEEKSEKSVIGALKKVDTPSVFFFMGILIAVAALQSAGHLVELASFLNDKIGNIYVINIVIGVLSSIVDNVPLVAGAMGMYDIAVAGSEAHLAGYGQDGEFWKFLAYCAGTGGSCLIIGSAAGVAIMGILKIDFIWYMKKISFLALIGYLAGAGVYLLMNQHNFPQ
jgi:Na+/H+ antiporter NhaD/arsenite permease-like protein